MKKILEIKALNKSYEDKQVLKDLSFILNQEEVLCILGPNGAGKSTLINILTGTLHYDSGSICYQNRSIFENLRLYKSVLGVVPQDLALYENLTAYDNVSFFGSLYGLVGKKLEEASLNILERVDLIHRKDDKVSSFSGGMKRRLNIACGIVHSPEIIILDEPTVGIDPQSRNSILELIKSLAKEGKAIIYTTHYMEEVETIATRIIILDEGVLVVEGTKRRLKEYIGDERIITVQLKEELMDPDKLFSIEGVQSVRQNKSELKIVSLKNIDNLDRIIALLIKDKVSIKSIQCETDNLETVFLQLTGKKLRD